MEFDVRNQEYTFKHSLSEHPDRSEERYREHFHTNFELLYMVNGDAQFMLNHTLYNIKPGSLLLAKPGEYHNIVFQSDRPYERYVLRFHARALSSPIYEQLQNARSVYYIAGSPIAEEFGRMDIHLNSIRGETRLFVCIGSMHIILSYLIHSGELTQNADYINEECRKIMTYIDLHLAEIHTIQDLSNALHMSKSVIYTIFSKQMHTPVMSYIRTQKCIRAKALMERGASATQAAEQLGFLHYSSFYRDYQKIFHESPGRLLHPSLS